MAKVIMGIWYRPIAIVCQLVPSGMDLIKEINDSGVGGIAPPSSPWTKLI
jgi:hypothetical protein